MAGKINSSFLSDVERLYGAGNESLLAMIFHLLILQLDFSVLINKMKNLKVSENGK